MTSLGNITRHYFERMTIAGPKVEPITTEQGGRRAQGADEGQEERDQKSTQMMPEAA